MGVPRLFRWLAERYPLVLRDLRPGDARALCGLVMPAQVSEIEAAARGDFSESSSSSSSSSGSSTGTESGSRSDLAPALPLGVDRLYLDFNGVVHHCAHGSGLHRTVEESGRPLAHDIFAYLERIVDVVKPQQVLYIAIDGVAPRAKMNQQRQRRYRSAAEREERVVELKRRRKARRQQRTVSLAPPVSETELPFAPAVADAAETASPNVDDGGVERDATAVGVTSVGKLSGDTNESLSDSDNSEEEVSVFDSNCITPGTEFMQKLSESLRFFIQKKVASDSAWANLKVILSGAEVPGEGEHKISEFIRSQKRRKDYDVDTTHCLYGMDADLMMLALASHEPNFLILREKVIFRQAGAADHRAMSFQQTEQFQLLSVGLLRDYLLNDLAPVASNGKQPVLSAESSAWFERKIDDFVFLCYLCGNDFLPALPFLDIGEDALQHIFEAYRICSLRWASGFLTDASNGSVNLDGFRDILRHLAANVEAAKFKVLAARAGVSERDAHSITDLVETVSFPTMTDPPAEIPATPDLPRSLPVPTDSEADRQFAALKLKSLLGVPETIDPGSLRLASKKSQRIDHDGALSEDISALLSEMSVGTTGSPAALQPVDEGKEELSPRNATKQQASLLPSTSKAPHKIVSALDSKGEQNTIRASASVSVQQKFEFEFKKSYYLERLLRGKFEDPASEKKRKKTENKIDVGAEVLDACLNYIEGMVWTFNYYYHGHLSWRWFYRYHAAPFASDFLLMLLDQDGSKARIGERFAKTFSPASAGKPFSPLCQLLAVLPPESASLLPVAHASLMSDDESPIRGMFHPPNGASKFDVIVDPSGRDYKNIALIPWIHEKKFLSAVRKAIEGHALTPVESERDQFGVAYVFSHVSKSSSVKAKARALKSPFPEDNALAQSVSTDEVVCKFVRPNEPSDIDAERNIFQSIWPPNVIPPGGFPSFVPLRDQVRFAGVQRIQATVVAGPSRNDTLLFALDSFAPDALSLKPRNEDSFQTFARRFVGSKRPIYVDFPFSRRAFVTAVAGRDFTYVISAKRGAVTAYPTANVAPYKHLHSTSMAGGSERRVLPESAPSSRFDVVGRALSIELKRRRGVEVGEVNAIVHAVFDAPSTYEVLLPVQCCILDEATVALLDAKRSLSVKHGSVDGSVKVGDPVLVLGSQGFGQVGVASAVDPEDTWVDVLISSTNITSAHEEFGAEIASRAASNDRFIRPSDVARALQVPPLALSRLTSSVTILCPPNASNLVAAAEGSTKCELGLGLKFSQRGLHVAGYARRVIVRNDDGTERALWEYSERATALLRQFREVAPELFEALSVDPHADSFSATELFGPDWNVKLARAMEWIRLSPVSDAPLVPADCVALPHSAILDVEAAASRFADAHPRKHLALPAVAETAAAKKRRRKANAQTTTVRCERGEYLCGRLSASTPDNPTLAAHISRKRPAVGDRVLYMKSYGMVPFGARGTVVSVYRNEIEIVLDFEVLSGSSLDGRLKTLRGARVEISTIINLTRSRAPRASAVDRAPSTSSASKKKHIASSNPFDLLEDE